MANNEKNNGNCGIRMMTQRERYEYFRKEVNSVKSKLMEASTTEAVETAINSLAVLMEKSVKDNQLKKIYNWTADINGTVRAVKMHDCTRKEMICLLDKMLENVESLISEEKSHEQVEKLRKLFLVCADNAETIAKIIDINKIVG